MSLPEKRIRVLVVDDHRMVRDGICALLGTIPDLEIVGQAGDGRTAIEMATELQPDVSVIDVAMPGLNGIETTRLLAMQPDCCQVVALSMHGEYRYVAEMMRAGAKGYVLKESAIDDLATAIREVKAGKVYVSPKLGTVLLEAHLLPPTLLPPGSKEAVDGSPSAVSILSPREREVLQLLSSGRATKEIARDLGVSVKTVETHRRQVMDKLQIFSVAELTKYAIRQGLTTLG